MDQNYIDLIILFLAIAALATIIYLLRYRGGGDHYHDDIVYDGDNEKEIIEAAAHLNQRRSGRERGGSLYLFRSKQDEPKDFLARLSLKFFRENEDKWSDNF